MNTEINKVAITTLLAMSQIPETFTATEIKNFYENIITQLPCFVFWKDKEFKYVFCNEITAVDLLKLSSASEIVGKTDFDFGLELETAKWVRQTDEEILRTGKPLLNIEMTVKRSNERILYLSVNRMPLFDNAGEAIGIIGISVDITAQKEAEQLKLKMEAETKNFYENIIAKLPCLVFWKDKDFKYVFCNEITAVNFLKLNSPSEIVGKTDFDFGWELETAKWVRQTDEEILRTGKPLLNIEVTVKATDGRNIHLSANRMPLFNSANEAIGIIGVSIDITAQKEAEQLKLEMERERQQNAILQLEKKAQQFLTEQQAKFNKIVDEAAHDIRSPLAVINSALSSCYELPEEKLTRLRRSLNNALSILYNLEDQRTRRSTSSSAGVESRQDLLIADYVAEVVDEKKYQYINHPIEFELHITELARTAHVDSQASQLQRSLSNIINNAIDALPENRNGIIQISVDANEKWVEITIRDNGTGMSPEAIQKIQQRISFTENKLHGHGLGLQQVGEMLEYNQGKMKIDSVVGEGTAFQLFFPLSTPASWLAREIVLQPDTILLLLEDDTSLHQAWGFLLGRFVRRCPAFQLRCFVEGEDVLRYVQALTDEERVRVLLLADYELTYQKQNGLEIIIGSQINNAILITGHSSNAEVRQAASERGINLLPKQYINKVNIRLATEVQ